MARKIRNVFMPSLTYDAILKSYNKTKLGKIYRPDVIQFNMKLEYNLQKIVTDLKNGTYSFGKFKEFKIYEPKERVILAAPFRDRIVHTWYVKNFLEKYFVPAFMHTSYACLARRGMHKCVLNVRNTLYNMSISKNCSRAYILKMDIAKFFYSIDRNILMRIIKKKIYDKDFIKLTCDIINSSSEYDSVPGVGIPIGSYCSQMFANIYLNELDQYCKHTLKCRHIFRYMDDTAIILKSKDEAKYVLDNITVFLWDKLRLKLNSKTNIFKLSQGVNFCGYKISAKGLKIRNRGKKKFKLKLKKVERLLSEAKISTKEAKKLLAGHIGYINISNISGLFKTK